MTHSAAGPDNVYNDSLIHLPPIGARMLLSIMNKSLSRGIVPLSWRQGAIIPLLMPQKPANELSSYRPITLTSTLCKLMDRVLTEHLVEQVPLSDTQAGFRKGWCTTDVLVWLRSRLLEKNTAAVFAVERSTPSITAASYGASSTERPTPTSSAGCMHSSVIARHACSTSTAITLVG